LKARPPCAGVSVAGSVRLFAGKVDGGDAAYWRGERNPHEIAAIAASFDPPRCYPEGVA